MTIKPVKVEYPSKMEAILPSDSSCLFDDVDSAVEATCAAQKKWTFSTRDQRKSVIQAVMKKGDEFAEDLAWAAWSDTGRGRYEDKVMKNRTAATKSVGIEDLDAKISTGTHGAMIVDYAPFGVIASITPTTNPTATVISNVITICTGGNGVVFQPHPSAANATCRAVAVLNEAIVAAGGPAHLITAIRKPTIEGAVQLMSHPKTAANLVTGGPAVVKKALASGKRSFCAGPGNPPVVVDETADITAAAKGVIYGASFDNNMICSDEKEVFVVEAVYEKFVDEMKLAGAYHLSAEQTEQIKKVIFHGHEVPHGEEGQVDHDLVGMNAGHILSKIGITDVSDDVRLAFCEVEPDDPLILSEQLMPILPVAKVPSYKEAVKRAKTSEHGYRHSAALWSRDIRRISDMPHHVLASNFVINGPTCSGLAVNGEGYTSFSIAGTTGEGYTRPSTFVRERRFVVVDGLRFV